MDTVVSNTDPNLTTSDGFSDWEPSIAVDPNDPSQVVIASFSSCWDNICGTGTNASIWTSTNGGTTWTKSFTIPPPPNGQGVNSGCPCDQAPDYDRSHRLYQTFLTETSTPRGFVYTGDTTNPGSAAAWQWHVTGGTADLTNVAGRDADQPWLLVNRDPTTSSEDDTYVAYDDFNTNPTGEYVAASKNAAPPSFTIDHSVGAGPGCCVNPGLRLAVDRSSGAVYALWEQATFNNNQNPKIKVQYMLNRSTDGGQTWTLNGSSGGIQIANVPSDQVYNATTAAQQKFGTVNALFGGIDHAAVDPTTGDVYYVYGVKDTVTNNNRLAIVRLTSNGTGGLTIGSPVFVTGQVQAALPSVAVASDGTIGVLYDTYDGKDVNGFPVFTTHLAESTNQGASFSDLSVLTFSSVVKDNGDARQRVLGDYQQLKAVGATFFGTFTANGATLGRPFANGDAMFLGVPLPPHIASFTPASATVGKRITLTGTGFTGTTSVDFTGQTIPVPATPETVTDSQITVKVPKGALTGPLTVHTPAGSVTTSSSLKVKPKITSFSPTSGPIGTLVTINGSAFIGATKVLFNGTMATSFTVVNYGEITATVPAGATTGPITVVTPGGKGKSQTNFTVT